MNKQTVSIQTTVNAPVDKVWEAYNNPESIQQWNQASDDWHCPSSENDLDVYKRQAVWCGMLLVKM